MEKEYNTAAIRELVESAFDDEGLSVFCHDHFHPVYEQFTAGQTKGHRVRMLVNYAGKTGFFEKLLLAVKKSNPYPYAKFESLLYQNPDQGERFRDETHSENRMGDDVRIEAGGDAAVATDQATTTIVKGDVGTYEQHFHGGRPYIPRFHFCTPRIGPQGAKKDRGGPRPL